ncbi:glycosyltransferase [Sporosarcina saromensis]|uniref:Glycosyltransferase n=1 Tax=Sporosarcina saromensis TaxID=359365 RepID=A0ABU4GCH4_9BACL|nr:glycosyltransferase [Sporosarcina saromensis]MDW0114010.1 glycosyltransferase [Sporosarcina saromensis]
MNIIHIEDFFHPDAGYQINILPKYMVQQGHEVTIITSNMDNAPNDLTGFFGKEDIDKRDKDYQKKTGVNIIRVKNRGFISGRAVFTKDLFEVVKNINPDILYIHGNDTLTAMRYLLKLKNYNYPIVMDSHMLAMASKNKFNKVFRFIYRNVFTPIIINKKIPVIRTQDDPYVEKFLNIPLGQSPWISVGSDTLLFYPDKDIRSEFRKNNNISDDDFVVVYTGKLDEAKGGMLLANAFEKKFDTNKNVVLIVVGNSNGEYGEKVEEMFLKSESRVIRFPTQKYTELARFYQASDLSVFPKQCSLSFYDAQACGLPVVSENNNINIQRLSNNNGRTFVAGDVEDFRMKVLNYINTPEDEYKQIRKNAIEYVKTNYNYSDIANEYIGIIQKEVERFGGNHSIK